MGEQNGTCFSMQDQDSYKENDNKRPFPSLKAAKPRVLIPVFPGTNCEYDTAKAFEKAGAKPEILVIKNLTAAHIEESVREAESSLQHSSEIQRLRMQFMKC